MRDCVDVQSPMKKKTTPATKKRAEKIINAAAPSTFVFTDPNSKLW